MKSIEEKVLSILVSVCGTKSVLKDLNQDLIKDSLLDSMGIVNLITEIEDLFEIDIPIDEFNPDDFKTASKIIDYVEKSIREDKRS